LGLAFKAETDDIRESSAIVIINELLKEGALVKAYDPQAMDSARIIWGDRIKYGVDEYDTVSGADGMVILTEWNQFRALDLDKINSMMDENLFFDFRNIYKRHEVEAQGLIYEGIGV